MMKVILKTLRLQHKMVFSILLTCQKLTKLYKFIIAPFVGFGGRLNNYMINVCESSWKGNFQNLIVFK